MRLIRAAIPEMRKVGGGRIINVTNLGGRTPGANSMPTSISRAAGIGITKGLSKDLASDNILVNTVCIGLIKSGQHERRYNARLENEPDLDMNDFYGQLAQGRGCAAGSRGRGSRSRRRNSVSGIRPRQLPVGSGDKHRRRSIGCTVVTVFAPNDLDQWILTGE